MKLFNKAERESATLSIVLNYKIKGMKEMVTHPLTVRVSELTNKEFNTILSILEDKAYKSRKMTMSLNKQTNGKDKN